MDQEKLITILKPLIRQCTQLKLSATNSAAVQSLHSKFGGIPYSEKGEEWPKCTKCGKGLTFICQINTADCKHQINTPALYTFFYCWECFPWGMSDEKPGQWVVRMYTEPSLEKLSPIQNHANHQYETQPCQVECVIQQMLPDWADLDHFSQQAINLCSQVNPEKPWEEYESAITSLNCLDEYATHVGGYPRWIQDGVSPECRKCSSRMMLFAQIDSEDDASIMWGDVGSVYLFQCADHLGEFHLELQCC